MYYTHNLHFIAVARALQGRYADAKRAAAMMSANVTPALKDMPMLEPFVLIEWLVELQFHRWDAVLALPKPADTASQRGMLWHYAQALALAGKGRTAEAVKMRDAYASLVAKVPEDAGFGTTNLAKPVLGIGVHVASAAIAESRKDWDAAVALWRQAVIAEDATNYDEPAAWYYAVRQSLGAALLKAGKPAEAETVFREGLALHPRDGRLLFGLLEALRAQKKTAAVSQVQAQFEEAWKTAEVKLTLTDL
jgi:tetratricopeptide (TPR) repeat protein